METILFTRKTLIFAKTCKEIRTLSHYLKGDTENLRTNENPWKRNVTQSYDVLNSVPQRKDAAKTEETHLHIHKRRTK